jgi:hypothetical protein
MGNFDQNPSKSMLPVFLPSYMVSDKSDSTEMRRIMSRKGDTIVDT